MIVYTLPNCQQCRATFRYLDSRYVGYDARDLTDYPEQQAVFKAMGVQQAPVILTTSGDVWCGFQPAKIDDYIKSLGSR